MERFGCCSSYVECSNALKCLHVGDLEYEGCYYRRKLENGIVYYGHNASCTIEIQSKQPKNECRTVYLACFRGLFAVYARNKNSFSYNLSAEQCSKLKEAFDTHGIPYRTEINTFDDIDGMIVEDNSPCNSRTMFSIDGEGFNVLNFNAYLIKNYYATMICKAFKNKGIESKVELLGTYARFSHKPYVALVSKPQVEAVKEKPPEPLKTKSIAYIQTSIFDMASVISN